MKYSDIKVSNFCDSGKSDAQVLISTLGALNKVMVGRKKLDLSALQVVVIDEADYFFGNERNYEEILQFHKLLNPQSTKDKKTGEEILAEPFYQYVLFSATYNDDVKQKIGKLIREA